MKQLLMISLIVIIMLTLQSCYTQLQLTTPRSLDDSEYVPAPNNSSGQNQTNYDDWNLYSQYQFFDYYYPAMYWDWAYNPYMMDPYWANPWYADPWYSGWHSSWYYSGYGGYGYWGGRHGMAVAYRNGTHSRGGVRTFGTPRGPRDDEGMANGIRPTNLRSSTPIDLPSAVRPTRGIRQNDAASARIDRSNATATHSTPVGKKTSSSKTPQTSRSSSPSSGSTNHGGREARTSSTSRTSSPPVSSSRNGGSSNSGNSRSSGSSGSSERNGSTRSR